MNSSPPRGDTKRSAWSSDVSVHELASTLETLLDGCFACDADWRIVYVNDTAERMFAISRDEVMGTSYWQAFPATLGTQLEREYRCVASGERRDFEYFDPDRNRWSRHRCVPRQNGGIFVGLQDITEQKRVEDALEKTRFILTETQKIAHVGSFEYIADTRQTVWSEEEYRIYGLDPAPPPPTHEDMLQRHIHPDDAARVHYTFATALHHCAVYELEHRIVRPDGQVRWVHNRAYPYCNGKEKPVRYIGATLDITERKQAQQALQASDERFNLAVQAAQEGVWDWNLETDEVWYSPRYKEMLGYAEEEIEHHLSSWLRLLHPDDREPCLQHVDAVKQGEREYEMEFRLRHKDGRYLAILSRGLPLKRASDGKVVRIVGTHLDLTARKRADAALRLSEERLRLALDAARMGAFHWNITTGEVVWTGSYRQVAGISSDMPANYANWLNSLFPEDRESADQQVREAMEKRKDLGFLSRICG